MDFSILESSAPSTADRLLKAQLQAEHVKVLWLILTGVIGILSMINWTDRLLKYAFGTEDANASSQLNSELEKVHVPTHTNKGHISIRRIPTAFAMAFKVAAFRLTVPIGYSAVASFTEVSFIFGYTLTMFVLLWIQTRDFETFLFEDRAAHLASCQLPLIVALAGKNNIISFLTGIGHEKLNVLHRASARLCLVFLWIHAMVRCAPGLPEVFSLSNGWMRWGVAGLTAFTLATLLSIRPIRHAAFEFFLVSHIILIAIFLVGGYLHAREPGFGSYIWPALIVWGFDRALRIARIIYNNRVWRKSDTHQQSAMVELISNDTIRLKLLRNMHWKAGQHAYVILPTVSNLPTEAHPFSIASIPHSLDGSNDGPEKELIFLIRARSGFTKKLREIAMGEAEKNIPAYIDGPYGNPPDLSRFSTCILIAGGSGISYTLPLLLDLIRLKKQGNASVEKVFFIWVVRDHDHLSWISKILLAALPLVPPNFDVDHRIHVTGKRTSGPDVKVLEYLYADSPSSPSSPSDGGWPDEKKMLENHIIRAIDTRKGRPNVQRLLDNAITQAKGPVSVDVAGPSNLSQSVRNALRSDLCNLSAILRGRQPVTLHIETFGMVKG